MPKYTLYLGLSLPLGRNKSEVFHYLVHGIRKIANSWSEHVLSKVGKMVMIKSVLQSLPICVMNCLRIPKKSAIN